MIPKKRKQMAFDIDEETHKKVKELAFKKNISMNLWIHRAILEKIYKETQNQG